MKLQKSMPIYIYVCVCVCVFVLVCVFAFLYNQIYVDQFSIITCQTTYLPPDLFGHS